MFDTLVGNERARETLRRMLERGRVPGALLFAGEEGLGKRLFALELARALNCRARRGVEACGVCPSCKRIGRFAPPPSDKDDYNQVLWSEHGDVGRVLPFNRNIYVEAIRDLERECNFRPVEGAARVFLIEDAEHLNDPSSNALPKTLQQATPTPTHPPHHRARSAPPDPPPPPPPRAPGCAAADHTLALPGRALRAARRRRA